MPSLTIREIATRKRQRQTIRDNKWYSNGHAFVLQYDDELRGWVIRAGCREWRNLSEALSHYHPAWYSSDGITTEEKRLQRRKIVRSIARFAKKHKFKMALS